MSNGMKERTPVTSSVMLPSAVVMAVLLATTVAERHGAGGFNPFICEGMGWENGVNRVTYPKRW